MINAVTVINHLGESLRMVLGAPKQTGFRISSITGLGPGSASINMTESSVMDGATFDSARIPSRNIVFTVEYMWAPTIEDSRQLTYKYFPLKKPVTLIFETDKKTCYITGYVETNEPDIFKANTNGQISIMCQDPYFYAYDVNMGTQTTSFNVLEKLFEFPFENTSPSVPTIEFAHYTGLKEGNIVYNGDEEIGVIIEIRAIGTIHNIILGNNNISGQQVIKINTDRIIELTGQTILEGDVITISSIKENKSALLVRDDTTYNILSAIDRTSDWMTLNKGDNLISFTASQGSEFLLITIKNNIKFVGL